MLKPTIVNIVYVEVLLQHRNIIRAPGKECEVLSAPLFEALCRNGQGRANVHLLLGDARELGDVLVQLLEISRLNYDLIRAANSQVLIQLDRANLYNLTAKAG